MHTYNLLQCCSSEMSSLDLNIWLSLLCSVILVSFTEILEQTHEEFDNAKLWQTFYKPCRYVRGKSMLFFYYLVAYYIYAIKFVHNLYFMERLCSSPWVVDNYTICHGLSNNNNLNSPHFRPQWPHLFLQNKSKWFINVQNKSKWGKWTWNLTVRKTACFVLSWE